MFLYIFALGIWYKPGYTLNRWNTCGERTPASWGNTKINASVSDFSQNNFMSDLDRKQTKWVTLPSNISPPVWHMWVDDFPFPFKGIWTPFLKGVGLLDQIAIFAYTPRVHTIFPVHSISWDLQIDVCACMINDHVCTPSEIKHTCVYNVRYVYVSTLMHTCVYKSYYSTCTYTICLYSHVVDASMCNTLSANGQLPFHQGPSQSSVLGHWSSVAASVCNCLPQLTNKTAKVRGVVPNIMQAVVDPGSACNMLLWLEIFFGGHGGSWGHESE